MSLAVRHARFIRNAFLSPGLNSNPHPPSPLLPILIVETHQRNRSEFEALQEQHESKNKEIAERGRMALAEFLLGSSDANAARNQRPLSTVIEEDAASSATCER